MWTRSQLKDNARLALTGRYWMAFLVCLVAGLLAGGSSGSAGGAGGTSAPGSLNSFNDANTDINRFSKFMFDNPAVVTVSVSVLVVLVLFAIGYTLFVANPIRVGKCTYFMENRLGKPGFARLVSGFNSNYINLVKTMLMKDLFVFLWSLLLLIPGIIKSYQYYFVEYLMAENPAMDWQRALELSRQMTDGEKWSIFVLELSFLGWLLLGALACGVGVAFVSPYTSATMAELYEANREKALQMNWASPQELPGFTLHA